VTTTQPTKISEALLRFAEPLLEFAAPNAAPEVLTPLVRMAVMVWNSAALAHLGRRSPYMTQAYDAISKGGLGKDEATAMRRMLAGMEALKRGEDVPDARLIAEFEFVHNDARELRLRVSVGQPRNPVPVDDGDDGAARAPLARLFTAEASTWRRVSPSARAALDASEVSLLGGSN
jgi:hypothetical protein